MFIKTSVHYLSNNTCYICLKQFSNKEITIDHVIPISEGGSDNIDNLKSCCFYCNQKKSIIESFLSKSRRKIRYNIAPHELKNIEKSYSYFYKIVMERNEDFMKPLKQQVYDYLIENFGEKCKDYERNCSNCQAWEGFDAIFGWDEDSTLEEGK